MPQKSLTYNYDATKKQRVVSPEEFFSIRAGITKEMAKQKNFPRMKIAESTDEIHGRRKSNTIFGTASEDTIMTDRGDDIVIAGDGDDLIVFGGGNDIYTLGEGMDTIFVPSKSRGSIYVTDFLSSADVLDLSAFGAFESLRGDGTLTATGVSELSILYEAAVTTLFVDQNGDGRAEMTVTLQGSFDAGTDLEAAFDLLLLPATNTAPVANPDYETVEQGASLTMDVLTNDADADGDALHIASIDAAQYGSVSVNPDGTITYTPAEGFLGVDSFDYTLADSEGASATTTVELTVEQTADTVPAQGPTLAFSGAEGFGKYAVGGRGGEILKVTNLDDSGVGSLRWALEDVSGPRFVVFEVGGVIRLQSEIRISDPNVTVAGQTAPGQGITLSGGRIKVNADEVIIRGLKMRPGDGIEGQEFSSRDGISVGGGSLSEPIKNIVIDHNSLTWATDENAAIWGNVSDITFSNNIIAQGLETPTEPGRATMGMIVSGGTIERVTIAKNFFAHNEDRNPYIRDATDVEIVNNYIYNYGDSGMRLSGTVTANVIGNYFESGENSPDRAPLYLSDGGEGKSSYYLHDNEWVKNGFYRTGNDVAHSSVNYIADQEVFSSNVSALNASLVRDHVLNNAGAMSGARDEIDFYLVETAMLGTGSSIDTLKEFPAQLDLTTYVTTALDTDNDGIPDWFEEQHEKLDPRRFDSHEDADQDGFTNIEEYANGLIDGFDMG